MQLVCTDADHADANKEIIRDWLATWIPRSEQAAEALRSVFELEGLTVGSFDGCLQRVQSSHQQLVNNLRL